MHAFDTPACIANVANWMYSALKNGQLLWRQGCYCGDIREIFLLTNYDGYRRRCMGVEPNRHIRTILKNMWSQAYYVINVCNLFIDGMAAKGSTVVGTALSNNYVGEEDQQKHRVIIQCFNTMQGLTQMGKWE